MKSWLSMRLMVLSLLSMLLAASIGLGLLFDLIFSTLADVEEPLEYSQEKILLNGLASIVDSSPSPLDQVETWQKSQAQQGYALNYTPFGEFPLPDSLANQLRAGEVLTLESEQHVSLHKILAAHNAVLTLSIPLPEEESPSLPWLMTVGFYGALALIMLI